MKKGLWRAAVLVLEGFLFIGLAAVVCACPTGPDPDDGYDDEDFAKLLPDDGDATDYFGISVAIDGDYAIIGARGADGVADWSGAAYVFVHGSNGWTQQAKLTAADGAGGNHFGCSVAISGDTAVVGAQYHRSLNLENAGAAYVFVRSGTGWTQQAKLVAEDATGGDQLGCAVSISGDYAVVGAYADQDNGFNAGSAYVFVRTAGGWSQQAKLVLATGVGAPWDDFGQAVAISGEYAVVGACGKDSYKGAAYIFVRSGTDWTEQEKLAAGDGVAGDYLGMSVSISEDYAVAGAHGKASNKGSVYVFVRGGTDWTEQAKLIPGDAAGGDAFGRSVSIDGDRVVAGACEDDDHGSGSGSAYIFARSGAVWAEQEKLAAADGAAEDYFGCSVSISGDRAVVGAAYDDDQGDNSGSACVYY